MKNSLIKGLMVVALASSVSFSANAGLSRTQHDAAVGAVLGGVAGAVVGNDITSTVAGAALGGVIGSQWNAHKHDNHHRKPQHGKIFHHDDHHKHKDMKHDNHRKDIKHDFKSHDKGHKSRHH